MALVPCPLCGYDAPAEPCPHCRRAPDDPSLAGPLAGPVRGILVGFAALPRGLYYLLTTPGVKRWIVPPLVLSSALLLAAWVAVYRAWSRFLERAVPGEIHLEPDPNSEVWGWLLWLWGYLLAALEWILSALLWLFTSDALQVFAWFLLGTLVTWYVFSIVYEALAGPFLDEIQGRIETRFFGSDPRSRLERPNDLPPERAGRLVGLAAVLGAGGLLALHLVLGVPFWRAALFLPVGLAPALLLDRRFGPWLLWVMKVEGRAAWASLQASLVTALVLALALPLYFVPAVGYFLFALVAGFATSVSLLDIAFERRGWPLRMRLSFVGSNLLALVAFGTTAGFLLAIPVVGPILMVPAASVGGVWLVCRLDKRRLGRPA